MVKSFRDMRFNIFFICLTLFLSVNLFSQKDANGCFNYDNYYKYWNYAVNSHSVYIKNDSLGNEIFRIYRSEVGNPDLYMQLDTVYIFERGFRDNNKVIIFTKQIVKTYWKSDRKSEVYIFDSRIINKSKMQKEIIRIETKKHQHIKDN